MATINELLKSLGVEDAGTTKTASAESLSSEGDVKKAASELGLNYQPKEDSTVKVASQTTGGKNMNLMDFYNLHTNEESTKVAAAQNDSVEDTEKVAAAELESVGAEAGRVFAQELSSELLKFAMSKLADEKAPYLENVGLDTNHAADADKAMDTDPEFYDLLDKAVAKKKIEKALAENEAQPGDGVTGVHSVDSGLAKIKSQKQA